MDGGLQGIKYRLNIATLNLVVIGVNVELQY